MNKIPVLAALLVAVVLAGCQSAATLSTAIRTGDTFIVGLSGEPEALMPNTAAEVIRVDDLTATITDSAGNSSPVRVRSVFRVFGDPTATSLAANQGQWIAVIDLVDDASVPLDLSIGNATLNISSPKLTQPLAIATTILTGTGVPHPLLGKETSGEKLANLVPSQQALVSVAGGLNGALLGAVQYQFFVTQEPIPTGLGKLSAIGAVKLQGRRDIAYQSWVTPAPAGGTNLTVIMTAPDGVAEADLHHLDIALIAGAISVADDPDSYFSGSLQEALFFDIDGAKLDGLQATVGMVQ
ncbi:MAG: hypothetical protein ACR2P1_22240 [Pseudomonadales bacterium]